MATSIPLRDLNDLDLIGEVLRAWCFVTDDHGGSYGGYSSFELRPGFKPVDNDCTKGKQLMALLTNNGNADPDFVADALKRAVCHSNGEIDVCWYWDGDGTLLFRFDGIAIENPDCKCSNGWRPVGTPDGLIDTHASSAKFDLAAASAHPVHGIANALLYAAHNMFLCEKFNLHHTASDIRSEIQVMATLAKYDQAQLTRIGNTLVVILEPLVTKYRNARDRHRLAAALAGARRALELLKPETAAA